MNSVADPVAPSASAAPSAAATAPARPLRSVESLPGPRQWPLVGNALQIRSQSFHQQLEAWAQVYGPTFQVRLGRRPFVVIGDHEAVAQVLRDRPDGFRRTQRLEQIWFELGLPPGVFGAHGDDWARQRRMVMAGFDPAHVRSYFPSMQKVAGRLHARWAKAARANRAIDLQPELMRYTVDTIAGLAFGAEVDTLGRDDDVIQQHLDKLFPVLFQRVLRPLPIWRWFPSRADRELARAIPEILAAVQGFIAEARARLAADPARRGHPPNLLEAMIVAAEQPGSGIDDRQVAGNVLTMLLAGEDTTANTLAWLLHLLWRHPEALARAVAEVRQALPDPDQLPTMEQLAGLDYLEACAHETMRLKPVAPLLPQQALRDTVIGDVRVPAGCTVINLLRRDSVSDSHLPRAAAFEPERWLGEGGPQAQARSAKRTSMPFGAGPRICPGRYLALLEIKLALAMLFSRFDLTEVATPDGAPAEEQLAMTMAPVGLTMRLRERAG